MATVVMIDGVIVPPHEAKVSVFDRGFLYGDSVFETIRTYGGKPFGLSAHLERLARSAERVFIELPAPLEQIGEEVLQALRAAGNPESYVRLMVTRGSGELGLAPDLAKAPLRVVLVLPLNPPPPAAYEQGVSVVTFKTARAADHTAASGAKVGNYLQSVLGMREAKRVGANEALVVDAAGNVIEGTTSNVFAVLAGTLVTPPEEAGILAGITRAGLLEAAAELGILVDYRVLPLPELLGAAEVFISSSIREVLPVVRVDDHVIGDGRPGSLTRALHARFRENALRRAGAKSA
jgi:branched-chain amino acid aminotransferase